MSKNLCNKAVQLKSCLVLINVGLEGQIFVDQLLALERYEEGIILVYPSPGNIPPSTPYSHLLEISANISDLDYANLVPR